MGKEHMLGTDHTAKKSFPAGGSAVASGFLTIEAVAPTNREGRAMSQRVVLLILSLAMFSGCAPSAQEKYDEAVRGLEQAQAHLDRLRPAYDTARQTAANAVCKEIAGATPEEAASNALAGFGNTLNQPIDGQAAAGAAAPADGKSAPAAKNEKKPAGRKGDDLDKTIDGLIAGQKDFQEKQAALTGPVAKAQAVMNNIKTPGTPEAKRFEEKLATMGEAKAYDRQQKRVEQAQKEVDEAKEALGK
jgi:hypothetical protein